MLHLQVRHDFYETESQVTIEVFLKNQKTEDVRVEFAKDSLTVEAKLPTDNYRLHLDFPHEIDPELSSFKVLSTKIEIRLRKTSAVHWSVLERKTVSSESQVDTAPLAAPSYPSSSLKKHDWDKLEKQIEAEESTQENEIGDLLKRIYQDGSSDVRRAMNKSFMESSGTVLSTNWQDVGKHKVDVKAPQGTDFKTFN